MTEAQLIKGVTDKDRDAVRCLVESYQKKVIKTSYYFLGNMEDAEDLAQEIFLEIVNSMGRFRGNASLSTWIYRITVNRSLNALKRKKRQEFLSMETFAGISDNMDHQTEGTGMEEQASMEEEKMQMVRSSVNSLKGKQKTAFILHKYEGLSYKEISEVMDTSLSSVESLMHRAKMNLQKSLARYYSKDLKTASL